MNKQEPDDSGDFERRLNVLFATCPVCDSVLNEEGTCENCERRTRVKTREYVSEHTHLR